MHLAKLAVEVILHEDVVVHLGRRLGIQAADAGLAVFPEPFPLREISGLEVIAEDAESSVGHQPFAIGIEESPVCLAGHRTRALLGEDGAGIFFFHVEDTLVVELRHGVQFGGLFFEFCLCLRIVERSDILQVQIDGMQRHDGDAAVGIGIRPGLGGSGIVDGEQL